MTQSQRATGRIGIFSIPEPFEVETASRDLDREEPLRLRLQPGDYEVIGHEHSNSNAQVEAIDLDTGEPHPMRLSFGLNATCTALLPSSSLGLPKDLAVKLDPDIRIASFAYAPGRIGYRMERSENLGE